MQTGTTSLLATHAVARRVAAWALAASLMVGCAREPVTIDGTADAARDTAEPDGALDAVVPDASPDAVREETVSRTDTRVTDVVAIADAATEAGIVACNYPQWWNAGYSWTPGYYAITGTYSWDNDISISVGTPIQLRHASRLVAEGTFAWGWMPEFVDTVSGERFAFLHLQPARRMTTAIGTTYPAGTLVGFSGGNTTDTGYCVPIPGCGTPDCSLAHCVYSTGAHLCVQTQTPYRTAFPLGTENCE